MQIRIAYQICCVMFCTLLLPATVSISSMLQHRNAGTGGAFRHFDCADSGDMGSVGLAPSALCTITGLMLFCDCRLNELQQTACQQDPSHQHQLSTNQLTVGDDLVTSVTFVYNVVIHTDAGLAA